MSVLVMHRDHVGLTFKNYLGNQLFTTHELITHASFQGAMVVFFFYAPVI